MGQGVYTSLAAMVAEELDLAWEDVKVEHGPPSAAYYNAVVVHESLPVAATDLSDGAERMRSIGSGLAKLMGMQMTGGSSSIPDSFMRMRKAGAAARLALIQAAANENGLPVAQLKTENGAVILPDGKRICYEALAQAAASVEVESDPSLKPESQWRYIGKTIPRVDVLGKSTGTAEYGIDIELPNMMYAAVRLHPKWKAARARSIRAKQSSCVV